MPRFLRLMLLTAVGIAMFSHSHAVTYYTYTSAATSGSWHSAATWTTDPSGITLTGSAVPANNDAVVILNGFTVTLTAPVTTTGHSITINNGGVLDLATFTVTTLNALAGSGTLRIKSSYFPTVTSNTFVNNAAAGATVEYADFGATVPVISTLPNVRFVNTTASNYVITLSNPSSYTLAVGGNFTTQASGSGQLTVTLGNAATNVITLNIAGNITIGPGTTWNTGVFNAFHSVSASGDMTNSGTVNFSNGTGGANLNFINATDNVLACNGTTTLYTLIVDKGTSSTNILSVTSTNVANLTLNSGGVQVTITNGTLRLGANINLPRLRNGGNYDLGSSSNSPMLWIDGATVNMSNSPLVVYGKFRITAGSFTATGSEGTVIREEGQYMIEGGTFTTEKFRPSNTASGHRGSFIMTGGIVNATGTGSNADYARFSMPFRDQVFIMTGGTINVANTVSGNQGGIHIGVKESNYTVTGGTFNAILTGSGTQFKILSTVPFYNLAISRTGSGVPTTVVLGSMPTGPPGYVDMTLTAQPLKVLNNFTIDGTNTPIFDAASLDVTVGGNYSIGSGATYTPGNNTTTFNGAAAQQFDNSGTITSGLYRLTVDKAGGTLTLGGTATSFTVSNQLTLTKGVLNDGGKIIQVTGNVSNSATHTGTGNITLSGTSTQTLAGDGNGVYGNVVLSNNANPGALASANLSISGILTLAGMGNSLFDINQYRLAMTSSSATAINTTENGFSNLKMIRTLGLQSDGGLRKTFGNLSAFLYPVGANNLYTPASIQLGAVPSSYGSITVRPVNSRNPFVVPGNTNNLNWYWNVSSAGFVGATLFTQRYYYDEASVSPSGDDTNYVPARYNPTSWTVINNLAEVNETTNEIRFANVSYIDGDYTAGQSSAFGTVKVFYSKRNGDWFNTTAGVTPWSNTSHTGPDANTSPGPGDHVYIGNGSTYNHTITISGNNARSGGLEIGSGSTLDVGTFTGHNFGALEDLPIGGSGTLRISSATATAEFPAGDFGNFIRASGGTIVYYTTGTQNFTIPLSSASPTLLPLITYRYLNIQPGASRTITLANQNVRVYNDMAIQGAASSAVAAIYGTATRSWLVNGNLSITGGTLAFQNGIAHAVDVDGNIAISNGASLSVAATGTAVANSLTVGGSITNNGTFDMSVGSNYCNVTFDGSSNASVTGTGATTDFNVLTVAKGTSMATVLDINASNFTLAPLAAPLVLANGTFRLSSAQSITIASGVDFNIPATTRLSANGGTLQLTGIDGIDMLLAGTLEILAGGVNVGGSTNDNSIEYASTGLPTISVSGGTLNVNAQIRRSAANAQGTLAYNQSSGIVNVGISSAITASRSLFEDFGTGSLFTMSGGLLRLQRMVDNPSTAAVDVMTELFLQPSGGSVTGGTIEVGNNSVSSQVIDIVTAVPLFNVSVAGNTSTGNLQSSALTLRGSLSIASGGLFLANGLNVSIAGDMTNANTDNATGITTGGYRAGTLNQTTTFNGSSGHQNITGVAGNLTNFGNLVISNTFTGGIVTLQPNSNLRVNGNFTLSTGTLAGAANTVTVVGTVSNSSTHTSSTGSITLASGSLQLVTGNGSGKFGNVVLNSGGAYLGANQEVTSNLTFSGGLLMLGSYGLNLSNTSLSSIVNSNVTTAYITTSGNLSDGGVTKAFAAGASGTFTFPVGVSGKYTPATYTLVNGGTPGTINVRPVNSKHPNATGTGLSYIRYYWRVATTGLAISSLNHTYTYNAADANGTESNYRDARFFGGLWSVGISPSNPNGSRVITFTNSTEISSDYTAGEQLAFVPATTYTSIASGPWEARSAVWSPDPGANSGPPPGSFIIISAGTTVSVGTSGKSMATMNVRGIVNLGITNSHNFGTVTSTGAGERTMQLQSSFFPAGDFSQFNSAAGGTVEYNGAVTLSATQSSYNNLSFTGAGIKELGNVNLTINGSINIAAGTVNNTVNRNISMTSSSADFTNSGTFNAGSGSVTIGRDLINTGAGAVFNGPNSTTGLKVMRNLVNGAGTTFTAGTDSVGVRGTLTNSGTFTSGSNTLRVNGNLQNLAGTFNGSSGSLSVGGALTNNAAFSAGAGSINVQGQLTNSGASAIYAANASNVTVNGSVNLTTSSQFNAGTGSITTNGNWTNSATFIAGTGTVNFTGSSNQTITGATTFYNVSRGGGNLTLSNDVTVGGLLTLSNGHIVTSANVLSLTNSTTQPVTGYSASAYVDGALSIAFPNTALETRVYPIASAGAYRPVTIQQTASSTAPVVRVRMTNTAPTGTPPSGVDRLSQARYYSINLLSGTMNAPTVDLSFNTNGAADETIATPTNARVLRSTSSSGPWTDAGGSGVFFPADPAGHVTSGLTSITSGTFFTLGYPNEVTPVTLVSFTAQLISDLVELSWATASEKNNHYFTVERSDHSLKFDSLFSIDGAGDSQLLLHYGAVDYSPLQGVSFYRLKQTDFDLKFSYSKVVRIEYNGTSGNALSLYPNPGRVNEPIKLKSGGLSTEMCSVFITDALGRILYAGMLDLSKPVNLRDLPLNYQLTSGAYVIRVSQGSRAEIRKLVIE
ncbi:T9SS type A sorting domain-containing protein [Chryseolinea sp. T2]|uniref:T9SS type A sorting domain-containing protein n=1 Tax=Chryseolinea sp. T2 TaxID=3129255 RepID=UPI0030776309